MMLEEILEAHQSGEDVTERLIELADAVKDRLKSMRNFYKGDGPLVEIRHVLTQIARVRPHDGTAMFMVNDKFLGGQEFPYDEQLYEFVSRAVSFTVSTKNTNTNIDHPDFQLVAKLILEILTRDRIRLNARFSEALAETDHPYVGITLFDYFGFVEDGRFPGLKLQGIDRDLMLFKLRISDRMALLREQIEDYLEA